MRKNVTHTGENMGGYFGRKNSGWKYPAIIFGEYLRNPRRLGLSGRNDPAQDRNVDRVGGGYAAGCRRMLADILDVARIYLLSSILRMGSENIRGSALPLCRILYANSAHKKAPFYAVKCACRDAYCRKGSSDGDYYIIT
jgi:hypothetical protein